MRNPTITTLKAIAIILVVVAHSKAPAYLSHFAYMLCVSLFFMASGYCFNTKYLTEEASFVKRRFKALYVPFVKWSVLFLLLNPFWFCTGILNEQYGNASRGVTHPLNLHDGLQSLWSIVFNMSGYDQFLCGVFWFFRALFIASILFLIGMKLIGSVRHLRDHHGTTAFLLALAAIGLALWQKSDDLKATGIAQGGYREFMGVFFLTAGFMYRRLELWLEAPADPPPLIEKNESAHYALQVATDGINAAADVLVKTLRALCSVPLLSFVICGAATFALAHYCHPSMTSQPTSFAAIGWLALSGVTGFIFFFHLSRLLRRIIPLRKIFAFIGENTLYVFVFHLLAFKLVSMVKVLAYDLPWRMIGGHPVVHSTEGQWFWVLYTLVGIGLPLTILWGLRYCCRRYAITDYRSFVIVIARLIWQGLRLLAGGIAVLAVLACTKGKEGIIVAVQFIGNRIKGLVFQIIDTIKASADVNQDIDDEDTEVEDAEIEDEDDEEDVEEDEIN